MGCGPSLPETGGPSGGSGSELGDGTTTLDSDATALGDGGSSSGSTRPVDSSGADDSGSTFIITPDIPTSCHLSICDTRQQDCPTGEKCAPSNGCLVEESWRTSWCYPLDEAPAALGEPCELADANLYSGNDNCELGALCWDVDPEVLTGFCVALCSIGDVPCPDANSCVIANDGALAVCLPTCDPLAQDCDGGHGCYPFRNGDTSFACAPEGLLVEVGQQVPPMCPPGSTDVDGTLLASCDDDAEVCCATFCNPVAPVCDGELVCTPLEDEPSVGLCLDG